MLNVKPEVLLVVILSGGCRSEGTRVSAHDGRTLTRLFILERFGPPARSRLRDAEALRRPFDRAQGRLSSIISGRGIGKIRDSSLPRSTSLRASARNDTKGFELFAIRGGCA